MAFSGPLCVRFGFFFSREDMKHRCKAKLACHLSQGLDCLPCGKTQQPYMPFSDLARQNARNGQMLPRLVFGLSQGQLVWEEEGKGGTLAY